MSIFKKKENQIADLDFSEDAFRITTAEKECIIEWKDVKSVFAYKIDLYTVDELNLDLFTKMNVNFRITEDHPGWNEFLERLLKAFPAIDPEFYDKLIHPAFETNFTLLYDAKGRSQDEAEDDCYRIEP